VIGELPCDLDCDGVLRDDAACGGTDCCDADPKVHPGQTQFFTKTNACGTWDFDCNGKSDPQWGQGEKCHICGFDCCDKEGFEGAPPACGGTGAHAKCAGGICGDATDDLTQGCR